MSSARLRIGTIVALVVWLAVVNSSQSAAQTPASDDHSEHQHDTTAAATASDEGREGSGTSWLPDMSPMYSMHATRGAWQWMFHGNAFFQYLDDSGRRGSDQLGGINWFMAMAARSAGSGRVTLRGMVSAEPWTIGGCGYPDLLASGERCDGEKIHDRQHPHDLLMELAAKYDAPLGRAVRWQVYGGPVGEPALGPVAFPHRVSSLPNPLAPIAHHWLDATHVTFGVVTGGLYGSRWKGEGSLFNGREPDENRKDLDLGALDSVSGRLWFLPHEQLALQVSAGRLREAEPGDQGEAAKDVTRVTASATYHSMAVADGIWATTAAWGRNVESSLATNAVLAETNVTWADRHSVYGRIELVGKTAHDLDLGESTEVFTVAKLQAGYSRYFSAWKGLKPGLGAAASLGLVPAPLKTTYGRRANPGLAIFATLRPAAMVM